jgi:hypothetical protein
MTSAFLATIDTQPRGAGQSAQGVDQGLGIVEVHDHAVAEHTARQLSAEQLWCLFTCGLH